MALTFARFLRESNVASYWAFNPDNAERIRECVEHMRNNRGDDLKGIWPSVGEMAEEWAQDAKDSEILQQLHERHRKVANELYSHFLSDFALYVVYGKSRDGIWKPDLTASYQPIVLAGAFKDLIELCWLSFFAMSKAFMAGGPDQQVDPEFSRLNQRYIDWGQTREARWDRLIQAGTA